MSMCNSGTEILNSDNVMSENGKHFGSIDEFDNSKNGRHKRNINKSNDRSVKIAKICKNEMTQLSDLSVEFSSGSDVGSNSTSSESALDGRSKRKRMRMKGRRKNEEERSDMDGPGSASRSRTRRGRKAKARKLGEDLEIKVEIKEEVDEMQDIVENFKVEPDVFDFVETKKELEECGNEKEQKKVSQLKQLKKMSKERIGGLKRGRPRKYSVVREKPSSYTCDYCQKVYPSEGNPHFFSFYTSHFTISHDIIHQQLRNRKLQSSTKINATPEKKEWGCFFKYDSYGLFLVYVVHAHWVELSVFIVKISV